VTASTCAAIVVALLDVCVGARYCEQLIRKKIQPRIATWLIFEIGVLMSLATYFTSHDHSVVKSSLNVTDSAVVTIILTALFIETRDRRIRFTRNEQLSLIVSCVSLAAWMITKTAWVGFAGFQLVMSVAYFPTIESLWACRPGRAPEPVETWSINAVAALIGVTIDLTGAHPDYIAMLYPLRAFILCVTVVVLLARWNFKNKMDRAQLS
jgi:hypothetical protein